VSETATETASVDSSDLTRENPASDPNISCNLCGTLTTWNPYCPSCGSYLEFNGTPAWHPDEQLSTIPAAPAVTAALADASIPIDASTDTNTAVTAALADASIPIDASTDTTPNPEADHSHESGVRQRLAELLAHGEHSAKETEKEVEHEVGAVKSNFKDHLHPSEHEVKPWWASWGDHEVLDPVTDEVSDLNPAAKVMAASGIAPDSETNNGTVFVSRRLIPARQIFTPGAELPGLPLDETQKTRAIGNENLDADGETCTRCELKNPAGRQYCDWCGTPLPGVTLGPESDIYNPYGLKSNGKVEVSKAPKRSYVLKITLLIVVLVSLIWAIWYFFFGPKAEQTRTVIKVAAQQFTEWLSPTAGANAVVTNVTASSSLAGTSPLALKSSNSRDFWASETMTLYGSGSTLKFTFDQPYEIDRVAVYPGIQNQTFDVNALATPRVVTINVGKGKVMQAAISEVETDGDYEQIINIPVVITDKVTITINQVYPPRYPDASGSVGEVAISAIAFLRVPSATTVNPLSTSAPTPSASTSKSTAAPAASSTN